MNKRLFTY